MQVFIKKRSRLWLSTILIILLVSVAFAVIGFTATYYQYVNNNAKLLMDEYTAMAVMDRVAFVTDNSEFYDENNHFDFDALSKFTIKKDADIQAIYDLTHNRDYIKLDSRELFRAVIGKADPVLSGSIDPLDYRSIEDQPRNSAALLVTCEEIEVQRSDSVYEGQGHIASNGNAVYKITFSIQEPLLIHQDYTLPETIYYYHWAFDPNGELPFQPGMQYIIIGNYYANPVDVTYYLNSNRRDRVLSTTKKEQLQYADIFIKESVMIEGDGYIYELLVPIGETLDTIIDGLPDTIFAASEENLATFCFPVTESVEATIEANPHLSDWLEVAKKNIASAYALTTDRLNSLYHFNIGNAWIAEGRGFTDEETTNGAAVCVIHKDLAAYNGIQVGDTISMDLYEFIGFYRDETIFDQFGFRDTDRHRGSLELEVVGIYTAPGDNYYDVNALSENTIIIPAQTVPIAKITPEEYEDETQRMNAEIAEMRDQINNPLLFTALLPANRVADFKAELESMGLSDYLIISDQGYSSISEYLTRITQSARQLFYFSLILLPVLLLILPVLARRERHELGLLLALGMTVKQARRQCMLGWAALLAVAVLISSLAAASLFEPLSQLATRQYYQAAERNDSFSEGDSRQMSYEELTEAFTQREHLWAIVPVTASQAALLFLCVWLVTQLSLRKGVPALVRAVE